MPLNGYLQDQAEEDRRGRVLAATNLFTQLSGIAFIFFHSFLSTYLGLTAKQELLVILIPSCLVGLITLRALPGGVSKFSGRLSEVLMPPRRLYGLSLKGSFSRVVRLARTLYLMALFLEESSAFSNALAQLAGKSVVVLGHRRPDGDCIGSQVALTRVLRSRESMHVR